MSLYQHRGVMLYTPNNSALSDANWVNYYETYLFNWSQGTLLDLDYLVSIHPTARFYIYFQSHGIRDRESEWIDSPGSAITQTSPPHNQIGHLRSSVKHLRDDEVSGVTSNDWALLDDEGEAFWGDSGDTLVLDIGNEEFVDFMKYFSLSMTETYGHAFLGIFWDNINPYSGTFTAVRTDTQVYGGYKSSAWVSEMVNWNNSLKSYLNDSGYISTGNIQGESDQLQDFKDISDATDGIMIEFCFTNSGESLRTGSDWLEYFNRALYIGATNKYSFLINPENGASPNATKQEGIMACVGLVLAPKLGFRPYGTYGNAYALSSMGDLEDLGGPITGIYESSAGIWERDFQNGSVEYNSNTGVGTITQTVGGAYTPTTYAPLVANCLNQTHAIGDYVSFNVYAEALGGSSGLETLSYSLTDAPPGISINSSTGEIYGKIRETADPSYTTTITTTATNGGGAVDHDQEITWAVTGAGGETYVARVNCASDEYDPSDGTVVWSDDVDFHDASDSDSSETAGSYVYDGSVPAHWPDVDIVRNWYRFDISGGGNQIPYDIVVDSATPVYVRVAIPGHASSGDYDVLINGVSAGTVSPTTVGAGNVGVYEFTNSGSGFTPTGGGPYEVRVQAGDGEALTARITAIEVYRVASAPDGVNPTLINPGDKTVTRGVAVDFPLVGYDWNSNGTTITQSGLPTGLSIVDDDSIQGTTTVTAGTYPVTLTITDDVESEFTEDVEINIYVVDAQAPTVTSVSSQSGKVGESGTLNISASSLDSGTLSYSATGLPRGKVINPSTGAITGQLLTNDNQQQVFNPVITVTNTTSNGSDTTDITFKWSVKTGDPIVRVDCGLGGSNTATGDDSVNWTLDSDSSSTYRTDPDSTLKIGRTMLRGSTVPDWIPSRVFGGHRYGASMTYTLPAGTTDDVVLNMVFGGFDIDEYTDVDVNGSSVIADLSPFDDADGGYALSLFKTALIAPNGSSNVVIDITQGASGGQPSIFALELLEYIVSETPVPLTGGYTDGFGSSVSEDLSVTVSDGGTLSYYAVGLPTGLSIDVFTGVVSGTASESDVFTPTITITNTRSDGGYSEASQGITWTIEAVAPIFTDPGTLTGYEGNAFSHDLNDDFEDPNELDITITLQSGTLPSWCDLTDGVLSGTPVEDDAGTTGSLVFRATNTDTEFVDSDPMEIEILEGTPTYLFPGTQSTLEGVLYSRDLNDDFTDPNGLTLTITVESGTLTWATLTDGVVEGTPTEGQTTIPPVAYRATNTNGLYVISPAYAIGVTEGTPTWNSDTLPNATQDVAFSYDLNDDFEDPNEVTLTITLNSGTLPAWCDLTDGVLSGTPDSEDVGSTGSLVFRATNANSLYVDTTSLTLTVNEPSESDTSGKGCFSFLPFNPWATF